MAAKKPKSLQLSTTKRRQHVAKVTELLIHGASDYFAPRKAKSRTSETIRRVRNPWVPEDVITLVKFVCTYGATKALVELIKAWLDYRKAKKVQVKAGDYELTIEGAVSDRVLESRINKFKALIQGTANQDIKVIVPKGADPRMPPRQKRK
jgi:hypothetical protein